MSNETRKMLEDILNGRMPVRRHRPQPGQSPFYYVVPKADDDTEISTVDIPVAKDQRPWLAAEKLNRFLPATLPLYEPRRDNQTSFVAEPYFMREIRADNRREKERKTADAALMAHLLDKEGYIPHLYLDTVGKNTFCIGHISASPEETARHPWCKEMNDGKEQNQGKLATRDEIFQTHRYIQTLPYGQKYGAQTFEDKSNLRLSEEYGRNLLDQDRATCQYAVT